MKGTIKAGGGKKGRKRNQKKIKRKTEYGQSAMLKRHSMMQLLVIKNINQR